METPTSFGQLGFWPLPVWFWPLLVCLGAWLFRRWMLRGAFSPVDRRGPSGTGWMLSVRKATPSGPTKPLPIAGWMPDSLLRRLSTSLAGLWHRTGSHGAGPDPIAVLGRRVVGPQQQVLVVRAGDQEHTVLLQGGAPALLLSTRAVKASGPRAPGRRPKPRGRAALGVLPKAAQGRRDPR
jgi:hypothetical protein